MKQLISPLVILVACSLLFLLFAAACGRGEQKTPAPTHSVTAESDQSQLALIEQFFSPAEVSALVAIKQKFEEGLRKGMESRTIAYAYEQHARRMRMDYFDQSPVTNLFPFNGKFDFSQVEDDVKKLPFMSYKCGFVIETSQEVVNYYCPSLYQPFFDYLAKAGQSSPLITAFVEEYPKVKAITPALKNQLLLGGEQELVFSNWDHQLFYFLFNCWVNEEIIAYTKVKNAQ